MKVDSHPIHSQLRINRMAINRGIPSWRLHLLHTSDSKKGLLSATNTRDPEEAPPTVSISKPHDMDSPESYFVCCVNLKG
jgi:hypothetical protein